MSTANRIAYDIRAAAEKCSVSEQTIRRALKSHALLGKRTGENGGGPFLIQHDELVAWIDSLEDA